MKRFFVVLMFITIIPAMCYSGEMYKWTDKNGVVRFTNTAPPPDAQKVGNEVNYKAEPITKDEDKPDYMKYDRPAKSSSSKSDSSGSVSENKTSEYRFNWSTPRVSGGDLTLSGSVERGEKCKLLSVEVFLVDENGLKKNITCQASDVGGSGSRIIHGTTSISSYYGSNWKITSQYPDCIRR